MVTTTADDHVGDLATVVELAAMSFAHRLATTRKQRGLTQQHLADAIGVHLSQVRRYEAASSQPTLDVLKRIAVALSVTIDELAFGTDERGPDQDLRLHFEAASRLEPDEQAVLRSLIEGLTLKHEARRWDVTPTA
jgi:transcriptional regulator with XRE-family HTH domain